MASGILVGSGISLISWAEISLEPGCNFYPCSRWIGSPLDKIGPAADMVDASRGKVGKLARKTPAMVGLGRAKVVRRHHTRSIPFSQARGTPDPGSLGTIFGATDFQVGLGPRFSPFGGNASRVKFGPGPWLVFAGKSQGNPGLWGCRKGFNPGGRENAPQGGTKKIG